MRVLAPVLVVARLVHVVRLVVVAAVRRHVLRLRVQQLLLLLVVVVLAGSCGGRRHVLRSRPAPGQLLRRLCRRLRHRGTTTGRQRLLRLPAATVDEMTACAAASVQHAASITRTRALLLVLLPLVPARISLLLVPAWILVTWR